MGAIQPYFNHDRTVQSYFGLFQERNQEEFQSCTAKKAGTFQVLRQAMTARIGRRKVRRPALPEGRKLTRWGFRQRIGVTRLRTKLLFQEARLAPRPSWISPTIRGNAGAPRRNLARCWSCCCC